MNDAAVVFVDDEEDIRLAAEQTLELAGISVRACADGAAVLSGLSTDWPGILVTDIRMPGLDGLALLKAVVARDPELPVVLVTGHGDVATAVQAMRDGAYDFIEKPFDGDHLVDVVRRALEHRRLVCENRRLKERLAAQTDPTARLVGQSPAMERVREVIRNVAATDAHVLIHGETGAGKEVVARLLHDLSGRDGNFVAINCGAMPESIFESELFGHEAGAFTGAERRRIGKFEHADGGTLFLDEIESMPLNLQVKLLRALQERAIERLGGNTLLPIDMRIVAATKTDLRAAADAGDFREDLYYRLNVVEILIPPLRVRGDDIALLFVHFMEQAAARFDRPLRPLSPGETARLMSHDWPGNVRELRNAAERRVLGLDGGVTAEPAPTRALPRQVEAFEKSLIVRALQTHRGSVKAAVAALGIPRKTFYDKLAKYGLSSADFR